MFRLRETNDGPSTHGIPSSELFYDADSSLACRQRIHSIGDLPLELLLEVFSHFEVAESWHPLFGCIRRSGLAKLMVVCRDWHILICTTAEFWRVIDTTDSLELISLCLRRSRGAMLDVLISLLRDNEVVMFPDQIRSLGGDAISLVVPHAARIRSLSVDVSPEDFCLVKPLFEERLSALQNLTIMPMRSRLLPRCWINMNLSQAMQPNIRSLVVRHVRLPPPSEFWHSLRVLKLYSSPDSTSSTMLAREILEILQNNPFLEEVHLLTSEHMRETPEGMSSLGASSKVYCPLLRTCFIFHGPLELVADLLSELKFPKDIPHVDVRIIYPIERFERAFSTTIPRHSRFLLERMTDVSFQAIPHCRLSSAICQFKLTSPSRRPTSAVSDGRFTSLAFECHHGSDYPQAASSLPGSLPFRFLTHVLAWTTVRYLRLTPLPDSTDVDTYEGFLDNFPSLESLALCPFSLVGTRDLLIALQPDRRESDGSLDIPRCPNLRTLAIHEGTPDGSGDYELLETLLECVRVRAEAGSRLDEVDVHLYCYTDWMLGVHEHRERRVLEVVERLRESVRSLVWKYGWDAGCKGCGG